MAKPLVSNEFRAAVEPLLPTQPPGPKARRARAPDRQALTGTLFLLKTGIQWEVLPQEMGCGCGMTCSRSRRDRHPAGVWAELHAGLLDRLAEADQIEWSPASLDSASVPAPHAPKGARRSERRRWDRTRPIAVRKARSTSPS